MSDREEEQQQQQEQQQVASESSSLFGETSSLYYDRDLFLKVPGLYLYRQALSPNQQKQLVDGILKQNKFPGLKYKLGQTGITPDSLDFRFLTTNQGVHFGVLPTYITSIVEELGNLEVGDKLLPKFIRYRLPKFNQVFYNLYLSNQGIRPHTDLKQFEDGILGISLLSSTTLRFQEILSDQVELGYHEASVLGDKVEVYVEPGDIYLLTDQARFHYAHSIEEKGWDMVNGNRVDREPRISLTLRKVGPLHPF